MLTVISFAAGLLLLLVGGRLLVSAAVDVATRLSVPPLLIGLTLVAWGTSFPELAFNLIAAMQGKPDLVLGNVVGANICNLGLVLGCCALIAPLAVSSQVIRSEIPLMTTMFGVMLLAALAASLDDLLYGRARAVLLLTLFVGYSAWTIYTGMRRRRVDLPLERQAEQAEILDHPVRSYGMIALLFAGGIVLLGVGGNLAAGAASNMRSRLGMSERVVGLTVVAVGTTLPELVTGVLAVRARQVDLAVGNAVGSCLFNLGLIYAVCRLIAPTPFPPDALPSLVCMFMLGMLLMPFSRTYKRHIARIEGAVLLLTQAGFVAYELVGRRG